MDGSAVRPKIPIPVMLLVIVALAVMGVILAQAAIGFFLGIVRLMLILAAFVAIAFVGLFLWRRGEKGD